MGFLRRRRQRREQTDALVVTAPPGMTWVREDDVGDWALKLASETISRLGDELPEYLSDSADVALSALKGMEPAQELPDETHRLAYNLVLAGYWTRVTLMQALKAQEVSAALTGVLRRLRDDAPEHAEGWFGGLQVAANTLGGATIGTDEQFELLLSELVAAVPDDAGEQFRMRLANDVTGALCEGVQEFSPGASDYLSAWDVHNLWEVGYWLRAFGAVAARGGARRTRRTPQLGWSRPPARGRYWPEAAAIDAASALPAVRRGSPRASALRASWRTLDRRVPYDRPKPLRWSA